MRYRFNPKRADSFHLLVLNAAIALILLLIGGCSDSAVDRDHPLLLELNELADRPKMDELIIRLTNIDKPEEFRVALDWQKQRFMHGKGGARSAYLYAYNLYRVGIKDGAALAYLAGSLQARVDGARCHDMSGVPQNISRWERKMAPMMELFHTMDEKERERLVQLALNREEKIKTRTPDKWICSGGITSFVKFHEKHQGSTHAPIMSGNDSGSVGTVKIDDDPSIKPEFIPFDAWEERRIKIRNQFLNSAAAKNRGK